MFFFPRFKTIVEYLIFENFPKVSVDDVLGDAGDEVAELHVDVTGVLRPGVDPAQETGQAGCEAGQTVRQPGLVAAVDGLADPVLPQPGLQPGGGPARSADVSSTVRTPPEREDSED